jgi:hypothetical protein
MMMARGGDPDLTWIEDDLIVASQVRAPFEEKRAFATVDSFLKKKFPDLAEGRIEKFIMAVERVAGDYLSLLALAELEEDVSRAATLKKYKQLLGSLGDFWRASTECLGAPWQLICRIDGHVSVTKDALDFVQLHEQLLRICRVASGIVNCLKGTAQDRTRPTRFLVHKLWSKWVDLGFPEPRLVRGADYRDADSPDEDAFAETIRLVIDVFREPSAQLELFAVAPCSALKPSDDEVTYTLRTIIEAGKKLRARE